MSDENPYTPAIRTAFKDLTNQDHVWMILHADVKKMTSDSSFIDNPLVLHLCGNATHNDGIYGWTCDNLYDFDEDIIHMQHDYLTPEMRFRSDSISIGMWHQSGPPVEVSNIRIEVYEHK